jgi:magnesium-transporting ATPase (P-type)
MAKLEGVRAENLQRNVLPGHTNVGIVIEGGALQWALEEHNQDLLMALCKECKAVVCCRVTPMQKAQVRTAAALGGRVCVGRLHATDCAMVKGDVLIA